VWGDDSKKKEKAIQLGVAHSEDQSSFNFVYLRHSHHYVIAGFEPEALVTQKVIPQAEDLGSALRKVDNDRLRDLQKNLGRLAGLPSYVLNRPLDARDQWDSKRPFGIVLFFFFTSF
jgi:hypothetical protein